CSSKDATGTWNRCVKYWRKWIGWKRVPTAAKAQLPIGWNHLRQVHLRQNQGKRKSPIGARGSRSSLTRSDRLMSTATQEDKGRLYWLFHNLRKGASQRIGAWIRRKPVVAFIVLLVSIYLLFVMRSMYQPLVLGLRKYIFWIFLAIVIVWIIRRLFRRTTVWKQVMGSLASLLLLIAVAWFLPRVVHYIS